MKVVIQRVNSASVVVNGKDVSSINKGLLVFVGIREDDSKKNAEYIIRKILNLRIFESENGFFDKSIQDVNGEILFVSQFTLYGDCTRGNRPSFSNSMPSILAKDFYHKFLYNFRQFYPKIKDGKFGANMQVSIVNDGPVTIILEG